MRIPLDYYRILGLPIQATPEQLRQAHRDRTLQLPRREYSEVAINARKQLIDEAYEVLANEETRKDYDSKFLAKAYALDDPEKEAIQETLAIPGEVSADAGEAALRALAADPVRTDTVYTPTIEIEPAQFVGALLILLELGEYELVIRLGRPYLSSGNLNLEETPGEQPQAILADTVLTLALACLELGREQWQQRQYETAAESLETGHELLVRENLFPVIRAEIHTELFKLRPYRILELLARPLEQGPERRQGLKLLKGMLQDRGGIEGTDDDLSGLSIDDFLRFIQQLRDYLMASEQQELFEAEARRPSAVATYLSVYALLARGFARHQPALVRRAKQLLMRVSAHQDVHLEQAVCSLLLGQTQEASQALELSQEYEPLAFIREHSQGAPDLLPGLCLYAERWLKDEVFPHFRDLQDQQNTLKEYFADPQVQSYLEAMPPEPAEAMSGGGVQWRSSRAQGTVGEAAPEPNTEFAPNAAYRHPAVAPDHRAIAKPFDPSEPDLAKEERVGHLPEEPAANAVSVAERVAQLSPEGKLEGTARAASRKTSAPAPQKRAPSAKLTPASGGTDHPGPAQQRRSRPPQAPRWGRLVLLFFAGLVGMGFLGWMTTRALEWLTGARSGSQIEGPALAIRVDRPVIEIPAAPTADQQIGVEDIAERAISNWLAAKREALGANYNIDILKTVLSEPVLSQWQRRAESAKRENWYWEYDHELDIQSVEPPDPSADTLKVTAIVKESGRYFEFGVENADSAYNDTLNMQYELVRQDGEWLVKDMNRVN